MAARRSVGWVGAASNSHGVDHVPATKVRSACPPLCPASARAPAAPNGRAIPLRRAVVPPFGTVAIQPAAQPATWANRAARSGAWGFRRLIEATATCPRDRWRLCTFPGSRPKPICTTLYAKKCSKLIPPPPQLYHICLRRCVQGTGIVVGEGLPSDAARTHASGEPPSNPPTGTTVGGVVVNR